MKRFPYILLTSALFLCLPMCRGSKSIKVQVPHGFSGTVLIDCKAHTGLPSETVEVDSTGRGAASTCPENGANVTVYRDGAPLDHSAVKWNRTGDQILVGFQFAIQ